MWCEQYEPRKSHTRLKFNFYRLLIIFLITQIHRVRFVSVNGEASRVKRSKKKFSKKLGKKILRKKCGKKKFWEKFFGKKCWKKNFAKKILDKEFWKKNKKKKLWKKNFEEKSFGKINSKTKIFITKLYSNIDKCHTIFALLAPFDKTGREIGSNENICGIWFKIGSLAHSHWTEVM